MWPVLQETADLVTFSEEILNGKFDFLCSVLLQVIYLITLVYSIDNCWNYAMLLKSSAGQTFYQLLFYWLDRQPKKCG